MLRLFVVSPKYDKPQESLAAFLALLAARGKVAVENGVYRRVAAG